MHETVPQIYLVLTFNSAILYIPSNLHLMLSLDLLFSSLGFQRSGCSLASGSFRLCTFSKNLSTFLFLHNFLSITSVL